MRVWILSIALAAVSWLLGWRLGRVALLRDLKRRVDKLAKARSEAKIAALSGRR